MCRAHTLHLGSLSLLLTLSVSAAGCASGPPLSRLTILPGRGVGSVRLLQPGERIQQQFGKPDRIRRYPRVRAIDYSKRLGVDFIVNQAENVIVQIHFNPGYRGRTPEGIGLGSPLGYVLKASGGALKRVTTSRERVDVHGNNRVLSRLTDPKPDEKYYFNDGCRGISYFIGPRDRVTQILVSQRSRSCACPWVQAALKKQPRQPAILPGQGTPRLRVSDPLAKVTRLLGLPDSQKSYRRHLWLSYIMSRHLDLIVRKGTNRVGEIRFNQGYTGRLPNGLGLCSPLAQVLKRSGGARKTVRTPRRGWLDHGTNRVLYRITYKNSQPGILFRDACRGILYWFDADQRASQIVVYRPRRSCECLSAKPRPGKPIPSPPQLRITPGAGNARVRVGDTIAQAINALGPPERRQTDGNTVWLIYWKRHHLDVLALKRSGRIIEVRFDPGYRGRLGSGVGLCSPLKDVLSAASGALKTVQVPHRQSMRHGSHRVLYKLVRRGKVRSYLFRDGCRGIIYWLDGTKRVNQIVTSRPSRDCECRGRNASLPALTAAQRRQLALTPHRGNGLVRIGDTAAAVKRKLGPPDLIFKTKTELTLSYRPSRGFQVRLRRPSGKVSRLSFHAGYRGRLPNGVGLCTSLATLKQRVGPPLQTVRAKDSSRKGPFAHRVLYHFTHPTHGITYQLRDTRAMVTYFLGADARVKTITLRP